MRHHARNLANASANSDQQVAQPGIADPTNRHSETSDRPSLVGRIAGADGYVLDGLDRQLIGLLRVDGRAPLARLSTALGVARGTVQSRLDRLMANGALLGFTVRTREELSSDRIAAIMMIEITGHHSRRVIRSLQGMPEIRRLHSTSGKWDLVAEIRVAQLADFDVILNRVRALDGVLNSETSLLLSSY